MEANRKRVERFVEHVEPRMDSARGIGLGVLLGGLFWGALAALAYLVAS